MPAYSRSEFPTINAGEVKKMKPYFLPFLLIATLATTTSAYGQKTVWNLQAQKGWSGYSLLPTSYAICGSCTPSGPSLTYSRTPGISSPSLSGSSTKHSIGGTLAYSDTLWNNHIIGNFSSQGLFDVDHTLVRALHNFIYDVYFYATNLSRSQALEFDINQFTGGKAFIFGHECRIAGGHQWDIYNPATHKWVPTGVSCYPVSNAWNHVVLKVQRTSGGHLLFKSITLNGKTATLNIYESPRSTSWSAVTINYQQDGNTSQQSYSIWLDKLKFTYW